MDTVNKFQPEKQPGLSESREVRTGNRGVAKRDITQIQLWKWILCSVVGMIFLVGSIGYDLVEGEATDKNFLAFMFTALCIAFLWSFIEQKQRK